MNTRERILAIGVMAILILVGGFFVVEGLFLSPLQKKSTEIVNLQDQIDKKTTCVDEIQAEMPLLDRWKALSLPSEVGVARLEYEKWLTNLVQEVGFVGPTVTPKPPDLKSGITATGMAATKTPPVYAKLGFSVTGRASLANLVRFLHKFYSAGLLHQVRVISIQRPQTQTAQQQRSDLDINLSIEALSLTGTDPRKFLLPNMDMRLLAVATSAAWRMGPVGLAFIPDAIGPRGSLGPGKLAPDDRDYDLIARKDIFIGRAPIVRGGNNYDPFRYYKLTDISETEEPRGNTIKKVKQASLFDLYNDRKPIRLQAESNSGYSDFRIMEENNTVLFRGKVVKINKRDLIFQGNDNFYRIKVGGTMQEAMKRPLSKEELVSEGVLQAKADGAPNAADDPKAAKTEINGEDSE